MKQDDKIIIMEIFFAAISIIIFITIIVFILKDEKKTYNKSQQNDIIEFISPTPIESTPSPKSIITIDKVQIIEESTEIKTEDIVQHPYKDLIENLTDYEKELIYKITFAEAGNQEEEGQRAVIEVILNRVISDNFPNTIEEVLSQKHQFTTWKIRNKIKQNDQDKIISILELVANEEPILPSLDYLFFARRKQTKYAIDFIKIQDHWFGAIK